MTRRRGLLLVLTGDGKGKTTSAFGQALRTSGSGHRVVIVQFIKGVWKTGEVTALTRTDLPIVVERTGLGFTIEGLRDPRIPMSAHATSARDGLERARGHIADPATDMVILDEVLGAIGAGLIETADVLDVVGERRPDQHVILTGRDAPAAIVAAADIVSEVRLVKHHFDAGIDAQQGIEF